MWPFGQAVTIWADFELTVDRALWDMMGVPQAIGACVTAQYNSVFARLKALQSLGHLHRAFESDLKKLGIFTGNLSSLNERRNRIVHDARFRTSSGDIARWEALANKTLKFDLQLESRASLLEFRDEVAAARKHFVFIIKPILARAKKLRSAAKLRLPRIAFSDFDEEDPPNVS